MSEKLCGNILRGCDMVMNNNLLSLCIMIPKCILNKGDKKLILTKQYKQCLSPTDLQIMFSWDVMQCSGK